MSSKKASIATYLVFIVLGIAFFIMARNFPPTSGLYVSGPSFYPELLSAVMVLAGVVGIAVTLKAKDTTIELANLHRVFYTFGIIVIWVILWQYTGKFYLISFVGSGVMLWLLNGEPASKKKLGKTLLINCIIIGAFFLVFRVLLKVNL